MTVSALYRQMYDALVENLGLTNFQLIGTPKDFVWKTPLTGQMDPSAYQTMSGMPLWSPIGNYSSKSALLFDAVRQVWGHVTFNVSPDMQQALTDLQDACNDKSNAITAANSNMNQAYLASKQNGGAIFAAKYADINAWLDNAPEAAAYNTTIQKAKDAYSQAVKMKTELEMAFMPSDLQRAIDAMQPPTGDPASSTAPVGWVKVPDGSGIIRWQPEFKIDTTGGDWRASLTKGSQAPINILLKASDANTNYKHSFADASAGYNAGFWSVSGSGGWSKTDIFDQDSSVTVKISAPSSVRVKVNPGDWYPGGFLNELAKATQGTAGQGYSLIPPWVVKGDQGSSSIFGQYGLVSTMVSELLVVYKPSFEITMGANTYKLAQQKINASAGIRIGPFSFGGSGGHESTSTITTSKLNTISGESTSENPQIIGVIVGFPGTDQA